MEYGTFLSEADWLMIPLPSGGVHDYQYMPVTPHVKAKKKAKKKGPSTHLNRRQLVYERDGGKCQYCGRSLAFAHATMDHVIPRSKGGSNLPGNLATACRRCNTAKGDLDVADFLKLIGKAEENPA